MNVKSGQSTPDTTLANRLYRCAPYIGAMLGLICFFLICGYKVLNPLYYQWLMVGDAAQHFMGWQFYRNAAWHFPLGYMDNITYTTGTSIVYTDSIPLLAIPLKLLSTYLPTYFQYRGIWMCLSFLLQGYFAAKLLQKITTHYAIVILGIIFFILSPTFIQKEVFNGWEGMGSLWLVIASLYFYFSNGQFKNQLKWILLLSIAVLIHFYVFGMVFAVFVAYCIKLCWQEGKSATKAIFQLWLMFVPITLFLMWIVGYFVISTKNSSLGGYGYFSLNLLAFINPSVYPSLFLNPFTVAPPQWQESYNYLGMGVLLLIILATYELSKNKAARGYVKKEFFPLFIIAIILVLFALSNKIYFGPHLIFSFSIPDFLYNLCSIYRSSGRMIAPVGYLLALISIAILARSDQKKRTIGFLLFFAIIQSADLFPLLRYYQDSDWQTPLRSTAWQQMMKKVKFIDFIPTQIYANNIYMPFAFLAMQNKVKFNTFYLSRFDMAAMNRYNDVLLNAYKASKLNPDTLYVWNPWPVPGRCISLITPSGFVSGKLDGYPIIVAKQIVKDIKSFKLTSCSDVADLANK